MESRSDVSTAEQELTRALLELEDAFVALRIVVTSRLVTRRPQGPPPPNKRGPKGGPGRPTDPRRTVDRPGIEKPPHYPRVSPSRRLAAFGRRVLERLWGFFS
jgi:hypothetical protein